MDKGFEPNSFLYSIKTLEKIRDNFVGELTLAAKGIKTSLPFIKNPLPIGQKPIDKVFQVMSIGGSVFESALVNTLDIQVSLSNIYQSELPVFNRSSTFLDFVNNHLNPNVRFLALDFAYPIREIIRNNLMDGIFIHGNKGNSFSGLEGKLVGEELENYIYSKKMKKIKIVLANDSICLILSGLEKAMPDELAAGIVGTGTNFAFFLKDNTIVNLESGYFNKMPFLKTSQKIPPKENFFEKEVSGIYLFRLFNFYCNKSHIHSTEELSKLAKTSKGYQSDLAIKLFEHSASLIACQMAGICFFKKRNLTFIMEGSLFWQGWKYKEMVKKYLTKLSIQNSAVKFIQVKHSNLIGASRLLLPKI